MEPTKQYTVAHDDRDASTFKLPGDDPGEAPFDLETNEAQHWRWYIHIDNGWNQNVDVTVEGSHTDDAAGSNTLDSPAADGSAVTVNSDSTDFIDGTTGHSQLQLDVAPAGDPTSGNLVVTFQRRKV